MKTQSAFQLSLLMLLAGMLLSTPALAEKPGWAGNGKDKGNKHGQQKNAHDENQHQHDHHGDGPAGSNINVDIHFGDQQRHVVHDYYGEQFRSGHCPPGLAKKNNGCMPPGQAKKWRRGYPLPRDVVYYDLPRPVVIQLGTPPSGYKYVRVAADILMIAVGTGMVVDAIEDLSNLN